MFVDMSAFTFVLIGFSNGNVALRKPAFASSIHDDRFAADHGVDGNNNTYAKYNGCFLTHVSDEEPWWMVDLLATYLVERIRITDRYDRMRGHLRDFNIDVYTTNPFLCPQAIPKRCTVFRGIFPHVETLTCNQEAIGIYIKLYMSSYHSRYHQIVFCEFEVEATLINKDPSFKSYKRLSGVRFNVSSSDGLTATLPVCGKTCARDETCAGFNYRRSLKTCYLFPATAEWIDLDASDSDLYTYYFC